MRLVLISDTHGLHDKVDRLPAGDVLIHAGDFMNSGYDVQDIVSFNRWLGEQPFEHRIVCAGNHDRYFENAPQLARELLTNATYLENTGITLDGVTFWGSPYTPEFMNWAFMYQLGSGAKYWELIPDDLDVLITHGPPLGILDQTARGEPHLGCAELLDTVKQKKPRVHVFGHIHGGAGTFESDGTRFINAAYLNERYKPLPPAGKIHVIDIYCSAAHCEVCYGAVGNGGNHSGLPEPYLFNWVYNKCMHTVVETAEFQKQAKAVWSDTEREAFIDWISANPDAGDVISGADGARKVRWSRPGMGKRGGVRVIYFHLSAEEIVLLVMVYAKAAQANVKPKDIKRGAKP